MEPSSARYVKFSLISFHGEWGGGLQCFAVKGSQINTTASTAISTTTTTTTQYTTMDRPSHLEEAQPVERALKVGGGWPSWLYGAGGGLLDFLFPHGDGDGKWEWEWN